MAARAEKGWMVRMYEWAHRTFPAYADCRPIDVSGLLKSGGFSVIESSHLSMWGLPVDVVLAHKSDS
jgi:demethylmenaquinone methyltransferase/2-methoxy-6-polyprenyl-1,4-benzoquinol methylase